MSTIYRYAEQAALPRHHCPGSIAFLKGAVMKYRVPFIRILTWTRPSLHCRKEISALKKGLFWVVGSGNERHLVTYAAECDANGAAVEGSLPYNSKKGGGFSHERSWAEAANGQPNSIRSKPWDYFPRGRVEIKNGKATVYYNPALGEWEAFELAIEQAFGLRLLPKTMSPDYSQPYKAKQEQNP